MGWDQGPYPFLDDCVERIAIEDAAPIISEREIEIVYALFQVYDEPLWAPAADGVDVDVWTLLRALLDARARHTIDLPFVFHWGFDVQNLDGAVVRALDAQIFCNRELLSSWTSPRADGGYGLDLFDDCAVSAFLDGDRPMLEFMHDDLSEPLSARTGEIHTVCVGRPFNIDTAALARRGIHLHVYGNGFDDVSRLIARHALRDGSARDRDRLREYVHLHPSLQPSGGSWAEVRATKSRWATEFSRYDAGWSYIGTPYPWTPLEDRAAIPNRLSTCLLAGLPVITDRRPGWYRYDELARLGVNLDLVDGDYDALHERLAEEVADRDGRTRALAVRAGASFDASIDELVEVLTQTRARYFARPLAERRRGIVDDGAPLLRLTGNARPGFRNGSARRLARSARDSTIGRHRERQARRLARALLP